MSDLPLPASNRDQTNFDLDPIFDVKQEFIIIIITLFLLQLPYKRVSFLLVMVLYFDRNKNIIDLD